jgi:hypothetical protein
VFSVRNKLGFYIPEDGILHSHWRESLKFYTTEAAPFLSIPNSLPLSYGRGRSRCLSTEGPKSVLRTFENARWEVCGLPRSGLRHNWRNNGTKYLIYFCNYHTSGRSRKQRLAAVGISCIDRVTPFCTQDLVLISPNSGGHSIGIVCLRTKSHGVHHNSGHIRRSIFYLKYKLSETGSCLRLQVRLTWLTLIERVLSLSATGPNWVRFTWGRSHEPVSETLCFGKRTRWRISPECDSHMIPSQVFISKEIHFARKVGYLQILGQNKTNSVALSPQANYTDWPTATCRRHLVLTFVDRWVSRGQRGGSLTAVKLSFLDRRRYFSFK